MLRRYAIARALWIIPPPAATKLSLAAGRGTGRGQPKRVPRSTAARHPGGAARLISLRHPWLRSNRRPLAGGQLPHAMTALKFGAQFLAIPPLHRSGGAGLAPDDAHGPSGMSRCGGLEGIRASSPAGETGMSEQAGADLSEARDGEGQLSKDALRAPAPRDAPVCARRSRVATLAA